MATITTNLINLINTALTRANHSATLNPNEQQNLNSSLLYNLNNSMPKTTLLLPSVNANIRILVTSIQFLLVLVGSINLLVVYVIISRPYVRSITNVYLVCLCISNFVYLSNLIFVVATQLNEKSWPFNATWCTIYHSMESTSKYSSVLFVVLLSVDRYVVMCLSDRYRRKRSYKNASLLSIMALFIAIFASFPLFIFSESITQNIYTTNNFVVLENAKKFCIVRWPTVKAAQIYIGIATCLIFCIPSILMVYTYFHVYRKLLEGIKRIKKLRISQQKRKSYQRVTVFVLWTILFHTICWFPFWMFNIVTSILRIQISTPSERILLNIIHLMPYFNCAFNPLVYAVNAKNFRRAICSVLTRQKEKSKIAKTAIFVRKRDSYNNEEKLLYHYVGESRPNPVLQKLVAAAAGCAEVAGVELELANVRDADSAMKETVTVSQAMIFPDLLLPEKENSSISSDEATEAANQDVNNLLEMLRRPLSSARRSMISLASRRSMVPEQTQFSVIPEMKTKNSDAVRKESRRHTETSSTSQYLFMPKAQMAKGGRASCNLEPRTYL